MYETIRKSCFKVRPYFTSNDQCVLFDGLCDRPYNSCFEGCCFQDLFTQHPCVVLIWLFLQGFCDSLSLATAYSLESSSFTLIHHYHLMLPARISLTPYRSSLPAGPNGYTPYPHIAAVCRFELVALLLLGHLRGSIGEHDLARPCFSSCFLHVWFL